MKDFPVGGLAVFIDGSKPLRGRLAFWFHYRPYRVAHARFNEETSIVIEGLPYHAVNTIQRLDLSVVFHNTAETGATCVDSSTNSFIPVRSSFLVFEERVVSNPVENGLDRGHVHREIFM